MNSIAKCGWLIALSLLSPSLVASDDSEGSIPLLDREVDALLNAVPPNEATALAAALAGADTPQWLSVSMAALQPRHPGNFGQRSWLVTNAGYHEGISEPGHEVPCLQAGLRLPDGATVTGFLMWSVDNHGSQNLLSRIRRKRLEAQPDATDILATISSEGQSPAVRVNSDLTIDHAVIDNNQFAYLVQACLTASDSRLYGLAVMYEPAP